MYWECSDLRLRDVAVRLKVSIPTLNKLFQWYGIQKGGIRGNVDRRGNRTASNPFRSKEVQGRIRMGWQAKGVNNPSQLSEVKDKKRLKAVEKFGVECVLQAAEVKDKIAQTNIGRYGTSIPSRNENVKSKRRATCLRLYGVDNPSKAQEVVDKIAVTQLERHGGIGLASPSVGKKIRATNKAKYGFENPAASATIKTKIQKSFKYHDFVFPSGRTERVQGYEGRFIQHLLNSGVPEGDIVVRPVEVEYTHSSGNIRHYRPDLYARSMFYEVKSPWYLHRYAADNIAKARGIVNLGLPFAFAVVGEKSVLGEVTLDQFIKEGPWKGAR